MCGFSNMACRILEAYGERQPRAEQPRRPRRLRQAPRAHLPACLTASLPSAPPAEVEFGSRDVLSDPELREGVKAYTAWPTIPQVFIGGEFVGGSDILMQMHQSGELATKLKEGDK